MSANKMCRIHILQKAEFYILNQPWNRLCKQCALSRALCGYKIEKELNSQQFENKIIFNALVEQLKNIISLCDNKSEQYLAYVEELSSNIRSFLSEPLNEIDQYIKKMVKIRDQILNVNLTYVETELKKLKETHTSYFIESIKFKKILQKLQGTFCKTITESYEQKDEQLFNRQINEIRQEIQNSKYLLQGPQETVDVEFQYKLIKIEFQKIFREFYVLLNQNKFSYFRNKEEQKVEQKVFTTSKLVNNLNQDNKNEKNTSLSAPSPTQSKKDGRKGERDQQNSEMMSRSIKPLTLRKASIKKQSNKSNQTKAENF